MVLQFTCGPHEIESLIVSISPYLCPLVPKIVGKSIKINPFVCFGISLHHILVKFPHFPRKLRGLSGTNGELRRRFYP